jgi:hypothetical protein
MQDADIHPGIDFLGSNWLYIISEGIIAIIT